MEVGPLARVLMLYGTDHEQTKELVNLVLGKPTVPELIQHEASPKKMAAALARFTARIPADVNRPGLYYM